MDYTNPEAAQPPSEAGLIFELGSLYTFFQQVPDTRGAQGKQYSLTLLMVLMRLAKLGGEDQPSGAVGRVAGAAPAESPQPHDLPPGVGTSHFRA